MRIPVSRGPARAFTILEIVVAMAIAMLIVGVAVMSLKGVDRESKLRQTAARLEWTARAAMREALVRRQSQCLRLASNGYAAENPSGELRWKRLPKSGSLEIRRWGEARWRKPGPGEAWWFRPGMPCEPISIRLILPEGRYEMTFDPLTATAMDVGLAVNP
jgi:type II secretory pathway pseudopilin PulG